MKRPGRTGRRWEHLKAQVRARHEPCCRCGQPINYTLHYPDPMSFSVDHHPYPLATHPWLAEDLGNLHAAHLVHNQQANKRTPADIGPTSEDW